MVAWLAGLDIRTLIAAATGINAVMGMLVLTAGARTRANKREIDGLREREVARDRRVRSLELAVRGLQQRTEGQADRISEIEALSSRG